jgi:hypothetical protein
MPPGPNAATGEVKTLRKKAGYWEDQKIQKKKSQLAKLELCFRCESLRTGGAGAAQKVSASDYDTFRKEVSAIRRLNAVVVLAVDAMHFESTLIPNLRDYVGGNPVVLAVTRCDLLPAFGNTDDDLLKDTYRERAEALNVAEVHLVSLPADGSKSVGIQGLVRVLEAQRRGRDVFVVGAANIGKSTLVKALIREFVDTQDFFLNTRARQGLFRKKWLTEVGAPTESPLPGTTLQNIRIPCFEDHTQALWDTPGLVIEGSTRVAFPIRDLERLRQSIPERRKAALFRVPATEAFSVKVGDDPEGEIARFDFRIRNEHEKPISVAWFSPYGAPASLSTERPPPIQKQEPATPPGVRPRSDPPTVEANEVRGVIEQEENRNDDEEQRLSALGSLFEMMRITIPKATDAESSAANRCWDIMIFDLGWLSVVAPQGAVIRVATCKKGAIVKGPLPSLCFEEGFRSEKAKSDNPFFRDSIGEHVDAEDDLGGSGLVPVGDYREWEGGDSIDIGSLVDYEDHAEEAPAPKPEYEWQQYEGAEVGWRYHSSAWERIQDRSKATQPRRGSSSSS